MALHLPCFSQCQSKLTNLKGYKNTLSTLLRTQQLKKKFAKYSNFDQEQLTKNTQRFQRKFYNNQSNYTFSKWKNDLISQKSQQFNRYSDYQGMVSSSMSKKIIRESQTKKNRRYFKEQTLLQNLKKRDQNQNLMISTSRQQQKPKNLEKKQGYFVSGNLQNKMNEYLNTLLKKSDQQYQQKLQRLQKQAEVNRVKREKRKYASQNHYYKVMKSSDLKRKRNSKSPFQQKNSDIFLQSSQAEKLNNQKALKQHIEFKSQLFRRTQKIIFNAESQHYHDQNQRYTNNNIIKGHLDHNKSISFNKK